MCMCAFVYYFVPACALFFLSLWKTFPLKNLFFIDLRFGPWFKLRDTKVRFWSIFSLQRRNCISMKCTMHFSQCTSLFSGVVITRCRFSTPPNPKSTPLKPHIRFFRCYQWFIYSMHVCVCPWAATLATNLSCSQLCIPGISVVDKTVACNINAVCYCGW